MSTALLSFTALVAGSIFATKQVNNQRTNFLEKHLGGVDEGSNLHKPVTERQNDLSDSMHIASSAELFDIAHQVDRQMVDGFSNFAGLSSNEKLALLEHGVNMFTDALRNRRRIIFSGSGTSGRIAFYVSRKYNALLRSLGQAEQFGYTISGGDSALLLSDELPEDDPDAGVNDLKEACGDGLSCLLVAITCGLSAPYCAGQVDYVLDQLDAEVDTEADCTTRDSHRKNDCSTILMGFNPAQLARNVIIERWANRTSGSRTVRDVVCRVLERTRKDNQQLIKDEKIITRALLLNPIIGPELVCASSRMKGGSTTLMLLETMCTRAIREVFSEQLTTRLKLSTEQELVTRHSSTIIEAYSACIDEAYSAENKASVAPLLDLAKATLKSGGHLYLLGTGAAPNTIPNNGAGNGGIIALIDQSEMPDTYGCAYDDIRAFVPEGWSGLDNVNGDLSQLSGLHRIGTSHFVSDVIPALKCNDMIIVVLGAQEKIDKLSMLNTACVEANHKGATIALLSVAKNSSKECKVEFETTHKSVLRLSATDLLPSLASLSDFALKATLNVITSGMQVACRRVYRNLMINFSPSNDKIYNRCIHQITICAKCPRYLAELALIRAIYKMDEISSRLILAPKSDHIRKATPQSEEQKLEPQIVQAVAILLASQQGPKTYSAAVQYVLNGGVDFDNL